MHNTIDSKQFLKIRLVGYRSRVLGIPRTNNWFLPLRPLSTDTTAWFDGWDLADKELKQNTKS